MSQTTIRMLAVAAALGVAAWSLSVFADPPDDESKDRPPRSQSADDPPARPEGGPPRRPPPLETALDQDHDHEISAAELEAATANLTKLDKNGDGKLTPDEYRPPRPDEQGRRAGPRDGQSPGEARGPRDGQGPREGRGGPRDGDGSRAGRRPPRDGNGPPRDGAKRGGDCPDGSPSAEKQKSAGKDE